MKTKIQYPGGLAIIIEHEEIAAPQLLEVKEDNFTIDLIKDCESLRRTVTEFESVNTQIMTENSELRTALENISIENNNNLATIRALKEELKQIFKEPITEIPTRHVSPSQQENFFKNNEEKPAEKAAPKWSKKPCSKCGELFQPTGPRSTLCENCKAEKQNEPAE